MPIYWHGNGNRKTREVSHELSASRDVRRVRRAINFVRYLRRAVDWPLVFGYGFLLVVLGLFWWSVWKSVS